MAMQAALSKLEEALMAALAMVHRRKTN